MDKIDLRSNRTRAVLLVAAAVFLVGTVDTCRMVADNVLGGRHGASDTGNCISDCSQVANEAIRAESDLHVANVHACDGDTTCLNNEEKRHDAAVAAIQTQRKTCQDNCRHQGGGSGGR